MSLYEGTVCVDLCYPCGLGVPEFWDEKKILLVVEMYGIKLEVCLKVPFHPYSCPL